MKAESSEKTISWRVVQPQLICNLSKSKTTKPNASVSSL